MRGRGKEKRGRWEGGRSGEGEEEEERKASVKEAREGERAAPMQPKTDREQAKEG